MLFETGTQVELMRYGQWEGPFTVTDRVGRTPEHLVLLNPENGVLFEEHADEHSVPYHIRRVEKQDPQDNVPDEESVSYEEVAEWWDNSEYSFSTYPPSDWHAVMCLKGWGMGRLRRNPKKVEDTIEEFIWGWCEVRDGHVPPTKDPDYSDEKWVAWDLQEDGTGRYFNAKILD